MISHDLLSAHVDKCMNREHLSSRQKPGRNLALQFLALLLVILAKSRSRMVTRLRVIDFDSTKVELLRTGVSTRNILYNDFYRELEI